MMDMLERGVDAKMWIQLSYVDIWLRPAGVQDREMKANELAAAFGPDTEVWYLSMLRNCGLLSAHEDIQRLSELVEAGHCRTGFVYDCEEEPDEAGSGVQSDFEDGGEGSGLDEEDGEGDIRIESDDDAICSATDEANELDEFWNAEEVV